MSIVTLQPDWSAPPSVHVRSTTRLGGVSAPPFDALNLGLHVGDSAESVAENRMRLQQALDMPSAPAWMRQVHGTEIARIEVPRLQQPPAVVHEYVITADAAITSMPGVVLAVMTADCLPVVVCDAAGAQVAVVHAGWRGLAGGILERVAAEFPAGAELHAWLGPAIGPTAFEVGEEVFEAFCAGDPAAATAFAPAEGQGKYVADLYALARRALTRERPVNVSGGDCCTHSDVRRFHSHRRDGTRSGRQATLAWLSRKPHRSR